MLKQDLWPLGWLYYAWEIGNDLFYTHLSEEVTNMRLAGEVVTFLFDIFVRHRPEIDQANQLLSQKYSY